MKAGSGDFRVVVETEMEGGLTLSVGFRSRVIRSCNQRGTDYWVHMVRKQSEDQSQGTGSIGAIDGGGDLEGKQKESNGLDSDE